jgi:hypothetical protein
MIRFSVIASVNTRPSPQNQIAVMSSLGGEGLGVRGLPRAKFNGAQRLAYTGVILMGPARC